MINRNVDSLKSKYIAAAVEDSQALNCGYIAFVKRERAMLWSPELAKSMSLQVKEDNNIPFAQASTFTKPQAGD